MPSAVRFKIGLGRIGDGQHAIIPARETRTQRVMHGVRIRARSERTPERQVEHDALHGGDGGDGGQQGDQQAHQTQPVPGIRTYGWAGAVHDSTASDSLRECGLWNARIYSIGFIRA